MNPSNRKGYSRGGSSIRRTFVPNIAAAGRVEKPKPSSPETRKESLAKSDHAAKRKRFDGSDGGGTWQKVNGADERGAKKNNIIKTEGLFSCLDHRQSQPGSHKLLPNGIKVELAEQTAGQLNGGVTKGEASAKGGSKQKHLADKNQKLELEISPKTSGFLADVPKVQRIPVVLPAMDAVQFQRYLTKQARRKLEALKIPHLSGVDEGSGCDRQKLKNEEERLEDKPTTSRGPYPKLKPHSNAQRSLRAGQRLRKLIEESHSHESPEGPPLMLFQLPSTFALPTGEASERHDAQLVGKLQLLRDGRVVIRVGSRKIDVMEAIPTGYYELAAGINALHAVPAANQQVIPDSRPSTREQSARTTSNTFTSLGHLEHSFLCTDSLDS